MAKVADYLLVFPAETRKQDTMMMRNFITISAFILIVVGTAGLLLNEFAWEHSPTRTIIFAVVTFVGLVNLAFARFSMGSK
jgi:hypothetical protein